MTQQLPTPQPEQAIEPVSATTIAGLREQEERSKALRRFNWLALYLPLILGTVLAIGLFGVLGWFALTGEAASADRAQASGIADVFVTMLCLAPLALIGAAIAGGGVFVLYWRREKGSLLRERLQGLMRGVDGRLNSADKRATIEQARVVHHTIKYRNLFDTYLDKLYYQAAQTASWINEKLARNRDQN